MHWFRNEAQSAPWWNQDGPPLNLSLYRVPLRTVYRLGHRAAPTLAGFIYAGFEVLMAVTMKCTLLWGVTL
jgi:hypothetical protein